MLPNRAEAAVLFHAVHRLGAVVNPIVPIYSARELRFILRQAESVALPAGAATGQTVTVSVPGKLTIHGVTKDVTASAKAQLSGSKVEVAGSVSIVMTDYGVTPPSVPFTTVDPQVTIEFDIFMTKAA